MARHKSLALLLPMAFALAACPDRRDDDKSANMADNQAAADKAFSAPGNENAGGKASAGRDRLLGSKTVDAKFTGFGGGHELSAKIRPSGRGAARTVLVGTAPAAAFLHAHKGETMKLKLDTVSRASRAEPDVPRQTVVKIVSAQKGAATSDAYWRTLPQKQRQCAEASLSGAIAFCDPDRSHRKHGERG
jgi:hypothetical protein